MSGSRILIVNNGFKINCKIRIVVIYCNQRQRHTGTTVKSRLGYLTHFGSDTEMQGTVSRPSSAKESRVTDHFQILEIGTFSNLGTVKRSMTEFHNTLYPVAVDSNQCKTFPLQFHSRTFANNSVDITGIKSAHTNAFHIRTDCQMPDICKCKSLFRDYFHLVAQHQSVEFGVHEGNRINGFDIGTQDHLSELAFAEERTLADMRHGVAGAGIGIGDGIRYNQHTVLRTVASVDIVKDVGGSVGQQTVSDAVNLFLDRIVRTDVRPY